jgi:hypothetical protein
MKPVNMINIVKRFTTQYGVNVTWQEPEITTNSRGKPVTNKSETTKSAKVLLLKEKFNPMKIIDTGVIGLGQDYTRYILALPDVEIKKDMIITDNHNMKWKLGFIDWFDIGGVPVCKQSSLTEVN